MRTAALFLLDLLRLPRPVAVELMTLRRRLAAVSRELGDMTEEERELARELRRLRVAIAAAIGRPACCGSCAGKYPLPHGRWPGGYCCGTDTWRVFTDDELWALAASGTRPWDWAPSLDDAAGCVFRGAHGCVLRAEHRPNICLRYLCLELVAELRATGEFKPLNAMCESVAATFRTCVELRAARNGRAEAESMQAALGVRPDQRPERP